MRVSVEDFTTSVHSSVVSTDCVAADLVDAVDDRRDGRRRLDSSIGTVLHAASGTVSTADHVSDTHCQLDPVDMRTAFGGDASVENVSSVGWLDALDTESSLSVRASILKVGAECVTW